ncbi:hypothetical protein C7N43_34655 [Sphingobacteriales bacterium UPWRP_1]|nr:hypothetical protein C7N43_34655 [Sphingobacteriales bacterium UPWRP_1]
MRNKVFLQIVFLAAGLLLTQHLLAVSTKRRRQGIIRVQNDSDFTIYYKPESDSTALPILPKSASTQELDGLATQLHKNKVYKVTRGILAYVKATGEVIPDYSYASILERLYAAVFGGWLSKPPDKGWQALFNAANAIN